MRDNKFFQSFWAGFFKVFRLQNQTTHQIKAEDISCYFLRVENDVNVAFENIKNKYERN